PAEPPPPLVPKITPQPAAQGPLYAPGERHRARPAPDLPAAPRPRRLGRGMVLALILVGLGAAAAGIYYLGTLLTGDVPPPAPVSRGASPPTVAEELARPRPDPKYAPPIIIRVPAGPPAGPSSPTPPTGWLTVRVKIDGVRVFIDEEAMGEVSSDTPLRLSLYLGPHLVRAEAPGRRPAKAEVEIVADREAILDLDLPEATPAGEGPAVPPGR
ncbi:MAG: PEGA domain-containing protein, partial [Acidobacteria bacterium]|nr:PEGA domain-containing protein [Acidobacteriota bacterium]